MSKAGRKAWSVWAGWMGALALFTSCAVAQYAPSAPQGNTHPPTEAVNPQGAEVESPFGPHGTDLSKVPTQAEKVEFARSVDLEPLRGLAVFHNGRVKVLDTLARETVSTITGRRTYVDFLKTPREGGGENVEAFNHDPLFTLLDIIIDPGYYLDKPLIHVNYLPLRREFVEAAFPGDKELQDRWLRVGRVTPIMVERYGPPIHQAHISEEPYREGLGRVEAGLNLFIDSKSNLELVSPERRDLPWRLVPTLPENHEARRAAVALGEAWRARDASRVNEAARTLAAALPGINPETYPQARRQLEITYNSVNAFEYGYWAYFISLVSLLLAFGTGRRWLLNTGVVLLVAAVLLHAFGFTARCIIAERFAIQNQFESMTGVSLFAAILGLVLMGTRKQPLFGAAAAATGFLVLVTATQTAIPGESIEREAAILNTSVLLKYHVTTVLVSYGLITLGFIISLFYLGTHYWAKFFPNSAQAAVVAGAGGGGTATAGGDADVVSVALGGDGKPVGRARTLQDLDTAQMVVLQLAFWTLGVGILLGAWWADHSWGRWWAFDPKETWALITWIVYLIVVHLRIASPANKGLTTAWLSLIGFIIMLWCYFGVNLLLPGLHAYA